MQNLTSGAHLDRHGGTCLLELASIRAGERFSDHPRCVQPTLGLLCRLVSDGVDDETRQSLLRLLPAISRSGSPDRRLDPIIVLACLSYAERFTTTRRLAQHRRRAQRFLSRLEDENRTRSFRGVIYRRLWVERAMTDAATVAWQQDQSNLVGMLEVAVAACSAMAANFTPVGLPLREIDEPAADYAWGADTRTDRTSGRWRNSSTAV